MLDLGIRPHVTLAMFKGTNPQEFTKWLHSYENYYLPGNWVPHCTLATRLKGKGIREIHIDDYSEIYALWSRTPGMGLSDADSMQNIAKFLIRNKGMSFCFEDDGKMIGTILCGNDGRRGYIYHVTVDVEYRGRGIGRALVEKSLERLKIEGIDKCHLFVFGDNVIGNDFWASSGWAKRDDIFVYSKSV